MLACFAITWRSSEESGLLIPCNTIINCTLIWYAYKIKPRTLLKDGLYIFLIMILNGCVIVDWLHKVLMSQHPLVITVITIISIIHFTVPVYFTEIGAFLWINFIDFDSCFDVQTEKWHPNINIYRTDFSQLSLLRVKNETWIWNLCLGNLKKHEQNLICNLIDLDRWHYHGTSRSMGERSWGRHSGAPLSLPLKILQFLISPSLLPIYLLFHPKILRKHSQAWKFANKITFCTHHFKCI